MYLSSCHSSHGLGWVSMRCLFFIFFWVLVSKPWGHSFIHLQLGTALSNSPRPLWGSCRLAQDALNWGRCCSISRYVIKARILWSAAASFEGFAWFARWTPLFFLLFCLSLREPSSWEVSNLVIFLCFVVNSYNRGLLTLWAHSWERNFFKRVHRLCPSWRVPLLLIIRTTHRLPDHNWARCIVGPSSW